MCPILARESIASSFQPGRMDLATEAEELTEVHNQRIPLLRVDIVLRSGHKKLFIDMDSHNTHFDGLDSAILLIKCMNLFNQRFELDRALGNERRVGEIGRDRSQPCEAKFICLIVISYFLLVLRYGIAPFRVLMRTTGVPK